MRMIFSLYLAIALTTMLSANNITVTNLSLTGQNTTAGVNNIANYSLVQFDISWENSWRISTGSSNWDAAWMFVKYKVNGNYISASGASSSGTTITVGSTAGLRVGMPISKTSGTGSIVAGTVVTAITDPTHFVVSVAPSTPLSSAVVTGYTIWEHATLNSTGHTAPSGSTISPASDGTGTFIYRDANGTGTFTKTGVQLRWNYGANSVADNAVIDIQIITIEMVYVPQGSFNAGDGATSGIQGQFNDYNSTSAFQITSESVPATLGGSASGNMRNNNASGMSTADDFNNTTTKSLPAVFPKGYNVFYCMKYEISQQEYVDFLNTLTYTQQATRTNIGVPPYSTAGTYIYDINYRNGIKISTSGTNYTVPAIYASDYPYVTCNAFSWADLAAYLDWSGLRPMTELEFEKSCRGTLAPVPNEYAWGNTNIATSAYTLSNSGASNEVIATNYDLTYGNIAYGTTTPFEGIKGPVRVGIFAGTSGNTDRIKAGATYYGIMEMSGNSMERSVTVGNAAGRSFTGLHGDGILNKNGEATVDYWPGINGNSIATVANSTYAGVTGVTNAAGAGSRGGCWLYPTLSYLQVSDRYDAAYNYAVRNLYHCGRGVRTASVFAPVIGQTYGGGIIFYIDGTGQHGLIAATTDQTGSIEWITGGSTQTTANGNTSTAFGTGHANTNYMIAQTGYTGGAAKVCDDYSVTVDLVTYSDWFLPSQNELIEMYLQKAIIGNLASSGYWSSSEYNATTAWRKDIGSGGEYYATKSATSAWVRAIRSF